MEISTEGDHNVFKRLYILIFTLLFSVLLSNGIGYAHTSLVEAIPAADSKISQGPGEIILTFNQPLEKELFTLKVYNHTRQNVAAHLPELSLSHRQIRLALPDLEEGAYMVSYYVVSGDGHPVRGSYIFLVGNAAYPAAGEYVSNGFDGMKWSVYFARSAYYLGFLTLTGWVFWGCFFSLPSEPIKKRYHSISLILQQTHLLGLLVMIALQWLGYSISAGLPLDTGFGFSILLSLLLSLIGFVFLFRSRWIDGCWIVLMLASQSFNGHSALYNFSFFTFLADFIHLLSAVIWAGGLLYIMVFWKQYRLHLTAFMPLFSKIALLSIVLLAMTGTLIVLFYLPDLTYLLYTTWGRLLLIKVALVILVYL